MIEIAITRHRALCTRISVMKTRNASFACPFSFSFYPRSRERGRLNIFLCRAKPTKERGRKKKRKEKGSSFRTSRYDVAKIISPKADESLMYFSENEKREKNTLSLSSFLLLFF